MEDQNRKIDRQGAKYSEENYTAYSIKVIEYLCNRYKRASETGEAADFRIDEIWSQDLKPIIGGNDSSEFYELLNALQSRTGYIEIHGDVVRLSEGRKAICEEVGITLSEFDDKS